MKLIPLLLLNVATTGVCLTAYHQVVRPEPASDQVESLGGEGVGRAEFDALRAEVAQREPALRVSGGGVDLAAVEDLIDARLRGRARSTPKASEGEASVVPVGGSTTDPMADPDGGLDEAEIVPESIRLFRERLEQVEALRREERAAAREKREIERINERLDGLKIGLTDQQKSDLIDLRKSTRTRLRESVAALRDAGADREQFRELWKNARTEVSEAVGQMVSNEDDAKRVVQIVSSLGSPRRGGFGTGMGGGGRRRGDR